MDRSLRTTLLTVAFALVLPTSLFAQEAITLVNPSFEEAGGSSPCVRVTDFNADVPGWSTDADPADSGVSDNSNATDGICAAWLFNNDPAIWQLTDHTIAAGMTYELTVSARSSWQTNLFEVALYYDDGGSRTVVATGTWDFEGISEPMVDIAATFVSDDVPAAVGHKLGVLITNTTAGVDAWAEVDNVRLTVSGGTAVDALSLPETFTLDQNYPNPFNPATTIRYALSQPGQVSLNVHDALGRTVARLVGVEQATGSHEVVWNALFDDGTPAPSGVYLYTLSVDGARALTRVMTLLR